MGPAKSTTLFTPDRSKNGPPTVQRPGDVLMRVGDQNLGDQPKPTAGKKEARNVDVPLERRIVVTGPL